MRYLMIAGASPSSRRVSALALGAMRFGTRPRSRRRSRSLIASSPQAVTSSTPRGGTTEVAAARARRYSAAGAPAAVGAQRPGRGGPACRGRRDHARGRSQGTRSCESVIRAKAAVIEALRRSSVVFGGPERIEGRFEGSALGEREGADPASARLVEKRENESRFSTTLRERRGGPSVYGQNTVATRGGFTGQPRRLAAAICTGPLPAGTSAVFAPRPTAGPALTFLQFLLGPPNAALSGSRLFRILDPTDELVAGQGRDVSPRVERRGVGD